MRATSKLLLKKQSTSGKARLNSTRSSRSSSPLIPISHRVLRAGSCRVEWACQSASPAWQGSWCSPRL